MQHTVRNLFFLLVFLFGSQSLFSQNLHVDFGFNMGASELFHGTKFKETPLLDQYEIIEEVKYRDNETYTWDNFEEDFGLKTHYIQPKFGFTAHITYADWPVMAVAEAMSSPSAYTKMSYGATIGFGKDLFNYDSTFTFSFLAGYKFVYDEGFGSSTLVNSVRDDYMRKRLETFFAPEQPLGRQRGNLLAVRGGVGKMLGYDKRWKVGVEAIGELDLIEKSVRVSRMTNVGLMAYLRYRI